MIWFIFFIFLLVIIGLLFILVRATRRLIEYDDLWQAILPVLQDYGDDLAKMSSANLDGILVDHPEVLNFHRRNRLAKQQIESLVGSIVKLVPEREKAPALPRPDME